MWKHNDQKCQWEWKDEHGRLHCFITDEFLYENLDNVFVRLWLKHRLGMPDEAFR